MTESGSKVIGYWLSKKKCLKLNWTTDFADVCKKHGYSLVKLNLDKPLEDQGPFSIIVHKLTEVIGKSIQGDKKAESMINRLEKYLEKHPEIAIVDPLDSVRRLMYRSTSYDVIYTSKLHEMDVITPTFVELNSTDVDVNKEILKTAGVTYPFLCKQSVALSTSESHTMCIIFNERGLKDVNPPCVAQSFVNHNAVLFKLYVLGGRYQVVRRPSLKNFYPSEDEETIFFNSHDVSKPDSQSELSVLDDREAGSQPVEADMRRMDAICSTLRSLLGMDLLGIDVVVENHSNRHVVIDINAYPGYDGYPDLFENLFQCIMEARDNHRSKQLQCAVDSGRKCHLLMGAKVTSAHPGANGAEHDHNRLPSANKAIERQF
ncbi:inositol-tetrakisphosphate 1-kinase [Nilaparvata lugens]|uniref:inositol-tetrakisphosphate 1-kinase n=1 Tax=Nilaparvata lugens TaxID=108931 RepID=UPI00193E07A2|nr:inositol-tetrakisphosphate 1-kinase [Nilaparvata lugens]